MERLSWGQGMGLGHPTGRRGVPGRDVPPSRTGWGKGCWGDKGGSYLPDNGGPGAGGAGQMRVQPQPHPGWPWCSPRRRGGGRSATPGPQLQAGIGPGGAQKGQGGGQPHRQSPPRSHGTRGDEPGPAPTPRDGGLVMAACSWLVLGSTKRGPQKLPTCSGRRGHVPGDTRGILVLTPRGFPQFGGRSGGVMTAPCPILGWLQPRAGRIRPCIRPPEPPNCR